VNVAGVLLFTVAFMFTFTFACNCTQRKQSGQIQ
jgi:hypothetical protein